MKRQINHHSIELDGVSNLDYPDFADAYVCYAEWADTGEPLTDPELDRLNEDHPEIAQQSALEGDY